MGQIANENTKRGIQRMIDAIENMIDALNDLKRAERDLQQECFYLAMSNGGNWSRLQSSIQSIDANNYGLAWLKNEAKSLERELQTLSQGGDR